MCRYVELSGCGDAVDADGEPSVGTADAFVSWNWDSEWEGLLGALEEHTQKAVTSGRRAPRYWLDIFAVNQHTALKKVKLPPASVVGEATDHGCSTAASSTSETFEATSAVVIRRTWG